MEIDGVTEALGRAAEDELVVCFPIIGADGTVDLAVVTCELCEGCVSALTVDSSRRRAVALAVKMAEVSATLDLAGARFRRVPSTRGQR